MAGGREVRAGKAYVEIPAAAYNAWVDAARAERNRQHDVAQDAGLENRQTTVVKVMNASGANSGEFWGHHTQFLTREGRFGRFRRWHA